MTRTRSLARLLFGASPALLVLAILLVARYPPALISGLPMGRDGGIFAYIGSEVLHGKLPIRDLWEDKPPGVFFIDAAAFAIGKPGLNTLLVLDAVHGAAVVLVAAWALRVVARPFVAAGLTVVFVLLYQHPNLLNGGNMTEQYALLPIFLGLGLGLRATRNGARAPLVLAAGLCGGVATTISALGAIVAIGLAMGIVSDARTPARLAISRLAWLSLGFALPLGAVVFFYGVEGGLPDLYSANVSFLGLYAPPWGKFLLAAAVVAMLTVAGAVRRRRRPLALVSQAVLLGSVLTIGTAAVAGAGHVYLHHLLIVLPAAMLALAMTIEIYLQQPPILGRSRAWVGAPLVAGLIVTGGVAEMASPDVPSWARAAAFVRGEPIALPPIVLEIKRRCSPAAAVYVWGKDPAINFLAGRASVGRYPDLIPLQTPGYENHARADELLVDLRRARPCAIVDASKLATAVPPIDPQAFATWVPLREDDVAKADAVLSPLRGWINANYHLASAVDGFPLWTPKP